MTNKNSDSLQKKHEHIILTTNFIATSNTLWDGDNGLCSLCLGNVWSGYRSCYAPFPIEPSPCTAVTWAVCARVGKENRQGGTRETHSFAFLDLLAEQLSVAWPVAEMKLNCLQGDRIFFHCPVSVSSSPCSQGPDAPELQMRARLPGSPTRVLLLAVQPRDVFQGLTPEGPALSGRIARACARALLPLAARAGSHSLLWWIGSLFLTQMLGVKALVYLPDLWGDFWYLGSLLLPCQEFFSYNNKLSL